jgi:hypothetical protein
VVEHSLGKGEVESSILSCSTSFQLTSYALQTFRAAVAARAWSLTRPSGFSTSFTRLICSIYTETRLRASPNATFGYCNLCLFEDALPERALAC